MQGSRASLLVVDDEPHNRQALAAVFTEFGYEVRSANDGFSALEEIRLRMPDIILSDLQMPGMSGFEFLSIVSRRFPVVRVIAMSGAFEGNAIPPGVAAHAFYPKGSRPGALLEIVGAMTEVRAAATVPAPDLPVMVWIARNIHDCSGKPFVLIACPECLRTFPERLSHEHLIHHIACAYCAHPMRYAIVQSEDMRLPLPPQAELSCQLDLYSRSA